MPPLTPVSLIGDLDKLPDRERDLLKGMLDLYDEAVAYGMIVGSECRVLDGETRKELQSAIEICEEALSNTDTGEEERALKLTGVIGSAKETLVSLRYETRFKLPRGLADADSAERIRTDYTISCPPLQNPMTPDIEFVKQLETLVDSMLRKMDLK